MPICQYRLNTKIRLTMLCLSGFELHSRWVPLGLQFGTSNCYKSSALTAPPRLLREMSNLGEFAGPRYSDL